MKSQHISHILYIINSLEGGGAEKALRYHLENLNDTHKEITLSLITFKGFDFLLPRKIQHCSFKHYFSISFAQLDTFIKNFHSQPDIIHSTFFASDSLALYLQSRYFPSAKIITTIHNMGSHQKFFKKKLHYILLKKFDHVIAVSEAVKTNVIHLQPKIMNISVVHPSTITAITAFSKKEKIHYKQKLCADLHIDTESIILIAIGRLHPVKNISKLIEVMKHIKNFPIVLLVYGTGPLENDLKKQINQNNQKNIHLMGYANDIAHILKAADMYISLSHSEAFPQVVLEAGANTCPVFHSDVGGIKEIITDLDTGFLCSPLETSFQIAQQIQRIFLQPALLETVAQNLREKIEKNFTLSMMMKNQMDVYERCL